MRRLVWTAWAVVFGLVFALILITKFSVMFSRDGIVFVWLVLIGVGCIACLKVARAERRTDMDRVLAALHEEIKGREAIDSE